jgi:hypothetical protein
MRLRPAAEILSGAVVLASLLLAAPSALAGSGQLGVSVTVAPSRPAPAALVHLPFPAGTQAMTAQRFGGSYRCEADLDATVAYYQTAMPALGYRLARARHEGDAASLVWEKPGERIELDLRQALGTTPTTRIVVVASAVDAG